MSTLVAPRTVGAGDGALARYRARIRERATPLRLPLVALAAALVVVGAFLPWATFDFGYPGWVHTSGAGGHRLYLLFLALGLLPAVWPMRGGRRAALAATVGVLLLAAGNLIVIAKDGGGLGAVAVGAWLAVVGGVVAVVAADTLPESPPPRPVPLPVVPAVLAIAAAVALGLYLVVVGLAIEASQQFLSYVAFLAFAAVALSAIGIFATFGALSERYRAVVVVALLAAAIAFPFTQEGNATWIRVAASIGVFAAAAIGLNVVVGLAGLLDLGYVAFFGVGAYTAALLSNATFTTTHVHVNFGYVIFLGALLAAVFGVIIGAPTLRLRGDYLAIVTLGFGEIFRIVANNWDGLTRGPNGISGVPNLQAPVVGFDFGRPHELFGVSLPYFSNYYYLELVVLVLVVVMFARLNDSRIGRAWVAIREDETAAQAMGVNTINLKLLAFAIGAFLAGAAGTVNAHLTTSVTPESYSFLESVTLLAAVVLGGMGTIPGAILGMTILQVLPEKLRTFQDYRLLLFGIALILLMRFRPEGIVASRRRQREFHDHDSGGDSLSGPVGGAAT